MDKLLQGTEFQAGGTASTKALRPTVFFQSFSNMCKWVLFKNRDHHDETICQCPAQFNRFPLDGPVEINKRETSSDEAVTYRFQAKGDSGGMVASL